MNEDDQRILVTGSEGLVGAALCRALAGAGFEVVRFDLRAPLGAGRADTRDAIAVQSAVERCAGVVHLAAVSRVIWGEHDPNTCWETNVGGTRNVLQAALTAPHRPWVLFASSREVYGQPGVLPASEDTPLAPLNVYGRSKVMGERMVEEARSAGLRAAVVRLSNVYGSAVDHDDRVIPSFVRAALRGARLRVDGSGHTFDFTHLDDAARGLLSIARALASVERLPPIHLVTGVPTALGELAALTIALAETAAEVVEAPPRDFDVARFYGCPQRAKALLGWEARVGLQEGLGRLLAETRVTLALGEATPLPSPSP